MTKIEDQEKQRELIFLKLRGLKKMKNNCDYPQIAKNLCTKALKTIAHGIKYPIKNQELMAFYAWMIRTVDYCQRIFKLGGIA